MKTIRILILTAAVMLASNSCVKEKLEETYNRQEEQIDRYVKGLLDKNETYTVSYNGGATRLTTLAGEGTALDGNGSVSFYYAGYTFKGSLSASNLFGTNHQETAESAKWDLTDNAYAIMEVNMQEDELLEGVKAGLIGVQAGEECEILFSGKYGFGKSPFGIIPANSALAFKIWVVGVSND